MTIITLTYDTAPISYILLYAVQWILHENNISPGDIGLKLELIGVKLESISYEAEFIPY